MKLRKVTLSDFDKIYPIYMDKTVNPFMSFPKVNKDEFLPIFKEFMSEIMLHENDKDILALIGLTRLPYRSSHVVYIHKLAINYEFQNQGLGGKLFEAVITNLKADGIKRLELKVEADNQKAVRFYKKIGFQIEGTLKGYFNRDGDIIDEHIMGMIIA